MNTYLIVKWLHVVSSVLLVGTGFGSAFYLFFANRSQSLEAQVVVSRLVIKADWWFTTPAVIVQPLSGFYMAYIAGFPLTSGWLAWALVIYVFAGACWLPVVWLQIKMHHIAEACFATQSPLPACYWRMARWWEGLGYPAFLSMLVMYWLMVAKPS
jgi:uncharacterized membrane protein